MGTHGLEIAVPSKRDHLTTSSVLISRGKNRLVDEVHLNVSYIVASTELLSERSCSKETEPCDVTDTRSRELEGNPTRARRLASSPVTLTARPVCFTKGTISALGKEVENPSRLPCVCKKNITFSTAISKMVTKLVRHVDQDERQTDVAEHCDSIRPVLLRALADKRAHEFSEQEWISSTLIKEVTRPGSSVV